MSDQRLSTPIANTGFRLLLNRFGDTPGRRAALLAGIPVREAALADPRGELPLSALVAFVANLNRLQGEGWVFEFDAMAEPTRHGPIGIALLSAPTLGEGLRLFTRVGAVRAPLFNVRLHTDGALSSIVFVEATSTPMAITGRVYEIAFLNLRALFAACRLRPPVEARFAFAGPPPAYAARVAAALGDGVCFEAPATSVSFPTAWMEVESPYADPAIHSVAARELLQLAARQADPAALRPRVERLLSAHLGGRLEAEACARALGVSRRTLVRRLAEEGTSFRRLRDEELQTRAASLSQTLGLTRARIAERLGYEDPASYARAERRWRAAESPGGRA